MKTTSNQSEGRHRAGWWSVPKSGSSLLGCIVLVLRATAGVVRPRLGTPLARWADGHPVAGRYGAHPECRGGPAAGAGQGSAGPTAADQPELAQATVVRSPIRATPPAEDPAWSTAWRATRTSGARPPARAGRPGRYHRPALPHEMSNVLRPCPADLAGYRTRAAHPSLGSADAPDPCG